MLENGDQGHVG
jgi:hypothetical protein